jgi:SNF2 family DNA or RNA helicase
MGLGKTIQSLAVVFNESLTVFKETKLKPVSLVVCPSSLTYNWDSEIRKFFDNKQF